MSGLLRGIFAYLAVLPLFGKLRLWRALLLTALVAVVLVAVLISAFAASGFAAFSLFDRLVELWTTGLGWSLLAAVVLLVLAVVGFKHVLLIVTAPWMGPVAQRVLEYRGIATGKEPSWFNWRSLRLNVRMLLLELLASTPLVLLALIPGIGIGAAIILFFVQAYFIGAGALDYALEMRLGYRESLAFLNSNRGLATGIGVVINLLLLTVVGTLFVPVLSSAAGAWAYAKTVHAKQGTMHQV